jgi:hypothetical protein
VRDLPLLAKEELRPEWQSEAPVLCAAGQSPLDEAAAAMLAQLLRKHGLESRVEGADAIGILNVLRLEASGVRLVCLSYLNAASPAHMRYVIRRLRRRLPGTKIILGCWLEDLDLAALSQAARPDAVAGTLREALNICLAEARSSQPELAAGADAA